MATRHEHYETIDDYGIETISAQDKAHKKLAVAMLIRALRDYNSSDQADRISARRWLKYSNKLLSAELCCDALNLDYSIIKLHFTRNTISTVIKKLSNKYKRA